MNKSKTLNAAESIIFLITAACVIGFFFRIMYRCSINIPWSDNYDATLNWLGSFLRTTVLKDKIGLIFSQYNGQRSVFANTLTLLNYYLAGSVNFKLLMFLGSAGLLGLLMVICKSSKIIRPFYFLPFVFLLFQIQYWESIYQGGAGLNIYWGLFFVFTTIFLLVKPAKKYFFPALFFFVLSIFSCSNGLLIFPIGLWLLIYQKRYRDLIVFITIAAVCFLFYFSGYPQMASCPNLAVFFRNPFRAIDWFLSFIGSSVGYAAMPSYTNAPWPHFIALMLGLVICVFFIRLTTKKYYQKNFTIYAFFVLLFLSAIVVTRYRLLMEVPFASRYQFFSIIFFILTFVVILESISPAQLKKTFPVLLVCSILFNGLSYWRHYPKVIRHKNRLIFSLFEWEINKTGLVYWGDPIQANNIMAEAIQQKIYIPPTLDKMIEGLKLNPNDYLGYNQRGVMYFYQRAYEKAIGDFTQALKINPEFKYAYENRLMVSCKLGNYDQAWDDAHRLFELGYRNPAEIKNLQKISGRKE